MNLAPASQMPVAFKNMFNLYAHELSEYNPWIGTQIDSDGNFISPIVNDYLTDSEKQAYVITESALPIGLAVFSSCEENGERLHDIEELFIVKTSRGRGICKEIAADFWKSHSGTGTLYVLKNNSPAVACWEKLLNESGLEFQKTTENEQMLLYKFKLK